MNAFYNTMNRCPQTKFHFCAERHVAILWNGACNTAGTFGAHLVIWATEIGRTASYSSWALTP